MRNFLLRHLVGPDTQFPAPEKAGYDVKRVPVPRDMKLVFGQINGESVWRFEPRKLAV